LTWSRPLQATTIKLYQAGWAVPITLDVTGGLYVKPATGAIVMGARTPPTSVLYNGSINCTLTFFSSNGIPSTASVINPNLDANNTLGELDGLRINSPGTVIKPTAANAAPLTTTNPASVVPHGDLDHRGHHRQLQAEGQRHGLALGHLLWFDRARCLHAESRGCGRRRLLHSHRSPTTAPSKSAASPAAHLPLMA